MSFVQIQTTFEKEKDAVKLARLLLKKKLGACIQIIKIKSYYNWKNKINKNNEYLCLIKTKESIIDEVISFIKENHAYEVPEIIVTPIIGGNSSYFDWIISETK